MWMSCAFVNSFFFFFKDYEPSNCDEAWFSHHTHQHTIMAASGEYRSSEQLRSLMFPSGVTPDPRLKMSEDWTGVLHGERRSWSRGTINKTEIRKQVRSHVRSWGIVFRVVPLPTRDKISRDAVLSYLILSYRVINHPWCLPQISLRMVIPAVAGGRVGNVQIRWRFAIDSLRLVSPSSECECEHLLTPLSRSVPPLWSRGGKFL